MTESRQEILITRYVDQSASPEDLRELTRMAQSDADLWNQLQQAVDDHAALMLAVDRETAIVDDISIRDLTNNPVPVEPALIQRPAHTLWSRWSGWAAAAVLAIVWVGLEQLPTARNLPTPISNPVQVSNVDDALANYISTAKSQGRLLQELPKVLIRTQPSADGTETEVTYLRQFVERVQATEFHGLDRINQTSPTLPVQWSGQSSGEMY